MLHGTLSNWYEKYPLIELINFLGSAFHLHISTNQNVTIFCWENKNNWVTWNCVIWQICIAKYSRALRNIGSRSKKRCTIHWPMGITNKCTICTAQGKNANTKFIVWYHIFYLKASGFIHQLANSTDHYYNNKPLSIVEFSNKGSNFQ